MMLDSADDDNRAVTLIQNMTRNTSGESEEVEVVSIWEISRRRSRRHHHAATQARAQGKRRQLRRIWGRTR